MSNIDFHSVLAQDNLGDAAGNVFYWVQNPQTIDFTVDGTLTIDPSGGASYFDITLDADATTVVWGSGAYKGQVLTLSLTQDGGGSQTFAWPDTIGYTGGEPPVISTGDELTDVFQFIWDGSVWQQLNAGSVGNAVGS